MSRLLTTAIALAALLPATAAADGRFVDAGARLTDEAFELRLESTERLGEPQVRVSPGFVRVWFPGMRAARLDVEGDGTAVRSARIRPGISDTAVTIIRIGDMRQLPLDAVAVHVDNEVARVRLTRGALPRPTVIETVTPPSEDLADLTADLEQPAEAPAEVAATEAAANAEATSEEAEVADASDEAEEAAAPPLALTRSADTLPLQASNGPSTTVILVVLTFLLGGAYLALRMFQKKKPAGPRADIEIVATKRLGARHQLLVVRALGEDHLLAVQQGKTERLASVPAPAGPEGGDGGRGELEEGALPFLKLSPEDATPGRTLHRSKVEDRPRFGADLMRLVAERSRGDRISMPAPTAPSEAIAGLLRLREKLGR